MASKDEMKPKAVNSNEDKKDNECEDWHPEQTVESGGKSVADSASESSRETGASRHPRSGKYRPRCKAYSPVNLQTTCLVGGRAVMEWQRARKKRWCRAPLVTQHQEQEQEQEQQR